MWRFFRFGVKSNTCSGNQAHFRVIGTTCANGECDDQIEESSDTTANKENIYNNYKINLAVKTAEEHQNFLRYNSLKWNSPRILSNAILDNLKFVDNSINQIQWHEYSSQRKILLSPESKKIESKRLLHIQKKQPPNKNLAAKINQNKDERILEEEERFGSLVKTDRKFDYLPDDKEEKRYLLQEKYGEKLEAQSYGQKMLKLCKEHKLKEALEVLEVEMKVRNVAPNEYCYNVLINACGKAGYEKKAFQLYNELKQKGLKVQKFAFTGLFNACANTPFKTDGLESAQRLRKELKDKEKFLPPISYHAMIKAFGRCGDIETAFEIADEMLDVRHPVTAETMNFLLQACITDRESGFRHALMVWRRMRALKISPCIYSYHLMLRCLIECQAGDPKLMSKLLEGLQPVHHKRFQRERRSTAKEQEEVSTHPLQKEAPQGDEFHSTTPSSTVADSKDRKVASKRVVSQIPEGHHVVEVRLDENMELEVISPEHQPPPQPPVATPTLPDVLARTFQPGKVVTISSLQTRVDRLWLLGGLSKVVENMLLDRVTPTVTTFTYLLEALPHTIDAEEALLTTMESCGVVPDVIFCNQLVKQRAFRSLDQAKEVLVLMQKHRVLVDLITFGCLAIGCTKPSQMDALFEDMNKAGFAPNEEIVDTLLQNCLTHNEFGYSIEVLRRMKKLQLTPNEKILDTLELTRKHIRERMIKQETTNSPLVSHRQRRIRDEMNLFLIEYKHWLKRSKVQLKDHPWTQFGHHEAPQRQIAKVSSI